MKLRRTILNIITALSLVLVPAAAVAGTAYAAGPSCGNSDTPKGQVLNGIGQTGDNCNDAPVNSVFRTAVNILTIIIGVAGVIMILFAGFRYITSGGEASRVGNAKNTLLYAVIGLAVAALAQLMVHFVLYQADTASNAQPQCPAGQHGTPPACVPD